jgi:hypothetical protein
MPLAQSDIGVVYTARGSDVGSGPPNWRARFPRFVESYRKYSPGIAHKLYIFYKEFATPEDLDWARDQFAPLKPVELLKHLDSKTTAGCTDICDDVNEDIICPLNSSSEIMHDMWLKKLHDVFGWFRVELVGCTGSREATPHIRDTAFLIDRVRYATIASQFDWIDPSRAGALNFEHGPNNLTQQTLRAGHKALTIFSQGFCRRERSCHCSGRMGPHNVSGQPAQRVGP